MAKALDLPTWALLSPSSLIPVSEVSSLLGALVQDFERPLGCYVPEDVGTVLKTFTKPVVVEEADFKATLEQNRRHDVEVRLGEIFEVAIGRSKGNTESRSSRRIVTYTLKQQPKLFKIIKSKYEKELQSMIEEAPARNHGAIFMVVGLKVGAETNVGSSTSVAKSVTVKTGLPLTETLFATTGVVLPVNVDIGITAKREKEVKTESTSVTVGDTIIAIQYRLVRKHRDWSDFIRPKRPDFTEIGDYHTVAPSKGLYSGLDDIDADAEENDQSDSEEDIVLASDDLELGDIDFTANLALAETEKDVMLVTL